MRTATAASPAADEEAFLEARAGGQPVAVLRAEASTEPADAPAEDAGDEPAEGELDPALLSKLARSIYPLLRRRLTIERERAGRGARWD